MSKSHAEYYKAMFKAWRVPAFGPKPTDEQLEAAHALGCRPGVQALHIAMALRPEGCTVAQFCGAGSCGPANNKRRELVTHKLITVDVVGKPYAYVAGLTAKGRAEIEKYRKRQADATAGAEAPKAKAKPRKRPSKPADAVNAGQGTDTAPVTQTAPVPAAEAGTQA